MADEDEGTNISVRVSSAVQRERMRSMLRQLTAPEGEAQGDLLERLLEQEMRRKKLPIPR